MKVCVVGLGYIGLPTSAMFADSGCEVIGVDVNKSVVDKLNQGAIHIEEPGLGEIINREVKSGLFRASCTPEEADVFIVSVPTPYNHDEFFSCDLTYVLKATESIIPFLRRGNTVIIESTIAPRSTDDHVKPIIEAAGFHIGTDIYLAHCPERVLPGQILHELVYNNRIVGGITPACTEKARDVYAKFVKGEIICTEAKTAELSKCMENTFRDVNIALANELAKICYELDINCLDVIRMANKHPRVNIHQPGPGVGGHCLAIDPYFIYAKAPEQAQLIKLARDINCSMPEFVCDFVESVLIRDKSSKIAALGVTYKGNVDDRRESPAALVISKLKADGYNVVVCDPHISDPDFVDIGTAAENADLLLVLTDHNEFKSLDHASLAAKMHTPVLFDTKNCVCEQAGSGLKIVNYGNMYMEKCCDQ